MDSDEIKPTRITIDWTDETKTKSEPTPDPAKVDKKGSVEFLNNLGMDVDVVADAGLFPSNKEFTLKPGQPHEPLKVGSPGKKGYDYDDGTSGPNVRPRRGTIDVS